VFTPVYCETITFKALSIVYTHIRSKTYVEYYRQVPYKLLIPFMEFAKNSKKNPNVIFSRGKKAELNFVGLTEIIPGQEIQLDYSNFHPNILKNSIELLNLGTCCEEGLTPNEKILININFEVDCENYIEKKELLDEMGKELNLTFPYHLAKSEDFGKLNFIRYLSVTSPWKEFEKNIIDRAIGLFNQTQDKFYIYYMEFSDQLDLEIDSILKFKSILERNYRALGQTLEDDIQFFESNKGSLSFNQKSIYQYRILYKTNFKSQLDFCEKILTLLSNFNRENFEEFLNNNNVLVGKYPEYFKFLRKIFLP
jgi:hypothetical protein